ncbi:hypothetical protein ACTNEO_08565 [Gracilibacillus sp. HCP3S3_G5_1]|uniref:hypothetical protein n=1 Tax=unclassified Gracilibacillus TaxID=2625209 RepID=UPI003F8B1D27
MNYFFYSLYGVILAIVSIITGEIITFIMLGFILIALQNIHRSLKELLKVQQEKSQ